MNLYFLCSNYSKTSLYLQVMCRCADEMDLPAAKTILLSHLETMDSALEHNMSAVKSAIEVEEASVSNSFSLLQSKHGVVEPLVNEATSALKESATAFDEKAASDLGALSEALCQLCSHSEKELRTAETKVERLGNSMISFLHEEVRPTPVTGELFFAIHSLFQVCYKSISF